MSNKMEVIIGQISTVLSHTHTTTSTTHSHTNSLRVFYSGGTYVDQIMAVRMNYWNWSQSAKSESSGEWAKGKTSSPPNITGGGHTHPVTSTGGTESRPSAIAVVYWRRRQ